MRRSLLVVLLWSAGSHAQSAIAAPAARDTVPAVVRHFPSPRTATWLSVGFTVVPTIAGAVIDANSGGGGGSALATLGLWIGPASGYWYGHASGAAWPGLIIRTGGLALAAVGAAGCVGEVVNSSACSSGETAAIVGGTVLVLGSAIWDIARVSGKVRARNAAAARAMVLPLFSPSRRSAGVEVVLGF